MKIRAKKKTDQLLSCTTVGRRFSVEAVLNGPLLEKGYFLRLYYYYLVGNYAVSLQQHHVLIRKDHSRIVSHLALRLNSSNVRADGRAHISAKENFAQDGQK